jgi:hypothetical protein
LSVKNLAYLSSDQALEDLVFFRKFITTKYNLKKLNKWIAFGAGYAGMGNHFVSHLTVWVLIICCAFLSDVYLSGP